MSSSPSKPSSPGPEKVPQPGWLFIEPLTPADAQGAAESQNPPTAGSSPLPAMSGTAAEAVAVAAPVEAQAKQTDAPEHPAGHPDATPALVATAHANFSQHLAYASSAPPAHAAQHHHVPLIDQDDLPMPGVDAGISHGVADDLHTSYALGAGSPAPQPLERIATEGLGESGSLLHALGDVGSSFAATLASLKQGALAKLDTGLSLSYLAATSGSSQALGGTASNGFVTIDATAKDGDGAALLHDLEALGMQLGSSFGAMASGVLPTDRLGDLAGLADLAFARQSMGFGDAGVVTTQGDHGQLSDLARSTYSVDGTGLTVGVLSDSFNAKGGMTTDIANGDLPASTSVLQDYSGSDATDEGRAMAQIVHDVAPGASILFATAYTGEAGFANNIVALANAGAKIIVDDVTYLAETAYQDGPIAQAIHQVVQAGALYFSSAGNNAANGFESRFIDAGWSPTFGEEMAQLTTGGDPELLPITLAPGDGVYIGLQWSQPAASVSPAHGATSDLDLIVLNGAGNLVTYSAANNIGGDPVELAALSNSTGSTQTYYIAVGLYAGPMPTEFKIITMGGSSSTSLGASSLNTNDGTIFGHAAAAGTIAVGAADYRDTPAYGVNPAQLEYYSSTGPTSVTYDTSGNPLAKADVRHIALVAPDGGDTSFFYPGDNPDHDGYPNFFGTSAAAPHAAAVAALMLQANPALDADDIRNLMEDSAADMDDPTTSAFDKGFDNATGAGLLQANLAVGYADTLIFTATAAKQVLAGTHLNDLFRGGPGSHTLDGGDGFDKLDYSSASGAVQVTLSSGTAINGFGGTDTIRNFESYFGGSGNDTFRGGPKNDVFNGNGGNDTLIGGSGDDTLTGGAGRDTFTMVSYLTAADRIDGGSDTDTVSINGDYSAGLVFGATTMVNVENLVLGAGSSYNLTLNDATNTSSLTVNSSALTTADHLILDGSAETGSPLTVFGGHGVDTLTGGAGADTFNMAGAMTAADTIDGQGGADVLNLNGDYSAGLTFAAGTMVNVESITVAAGHNYSLTLKDATNAGGLTITGATLAAANHLIIDDSAETSSTLTAFGGLGKDTFTGGAVRDVLQGNAGNDILNGGAGGDTLQGNAGNDVLTGGVGNDSLIGAGGNDILRGNTGSDLLWGGLGDDKLTGGGGRDFFKYTLPSDAGTGHEVVTDFEKGGTGDVLDVHDLLHGFGGYDGTNAFTGGYLDFKASAGDTVVRVDADGGGNNYTTLVTLQHVSLTAADTENYSV